tara:strand:- start:2183 stop:2776 length:594 start_codon:yes stop_codon:yes gene_type:complete
MEIGHKGVKANKSLPQIQSEIDESFFEIKFKINGKVFKIAVDGLLKFEKEDPADWNDNAIDKGMQECSYYRYTFLAAAEELGQKILQTEREFEAWKLEAYSNARSQIIDERLIVKQEKNVPNNWFGSITKEELGRMVMQHPEFISYSDRLAEMKKNEKLLRTLSLIMHERGGYLQSIGKRRLEQQKMNFRSYGESLI